MVNWRRINEPSYKKRNLEVGRLVDSVELARAAVVDWLDSRSLSLAHLHHLSFYFQHQYLNIQTISRLPTHYSLTIFEFKFSYCQQKIKKDVVLEKCVIDTNPSASVQPLESTRRVHRPSFCPGRCQTISPSSLADPKSCSSHLFLFFRSLLSHHGSVWILQINQMELIMNLNCYE